MDEFTQVLEMLKKFYAVETIEEVVLKQDQHINRLQKRLCSPFNQEFYTTKVREG